MEKLKNSVHNSTTFYRMTTTPNYFQFNSPVTEMNFAGKPEITENGFAIFDAQHSNMEKSKNSVQNSTMIHNTRPNYFPSTIYPVTETNGARRPEITENGFAIFDAQPPNMGLSLNSTENRNIEKNPISVWSDWKLVSSCRSGCLHYSKGLRLVQRNCLSGDCQGPTSSVQLCVPNEQVNRQIVMVILFTYANYLPTGMSNLPVS